MAALSISRAWVDTKARIASDGRLFARVAAALLLLPQAVIVVLAPPAELSGVEPPSWVNLLALAAGLIGIIGQVAIIRLALVPATSVGEAISHGLKRFLPVLGAVLILMCAVFLALVPLMLMFGLLGALTGAESEAGAGSVAIAAILVLAAAIFIGARFLMLMPVATAEAGGPLHIIKRSWSLTSGSYMRLLGFMILIVIAAVVVVVAIQLVLGSLLSLVFGDIEPLSLGALAYALLFGAIQAGLAIIVSVMLARIYLQLSGDEALDVTVPKTGT